MEPIHEETALPWAIDLLLRHRWCSRPRMADKLTSRRASKCCPMPRHDHYYQEIAVAVAVAICAFMAFKLFVFVFKIIGLL